MRVRRYARPVRVLHAVQSLDPASGGPPQVVTRLAAAQAGLGCEVTLLARSEPERRAAIDASIASLPHADRLEVVTIEPGSSRLGAMVATAAERWSRAHASSFDFVHLHSMWSPVPHAVARGARRGGVPYTVCPHGMLDHWAMARSRLKKRAHLATISGPTLRRAAFIHALNEHEAACVRGLGFSTPAEILNNGVFLEEYASLPAPGAFRAAHPTLGEGPLVVFLSRLHFKKGLDHLAGAFRTVAATHPDARLVVIGPDDGAQADFERRIAAAGLGDRVLLTGPMYGPEKLAALVDAACFCLPSRQEGFSVAICEALACSTPVVISRECNFPEVAEAEAGLVVPLSTERVADALLSVLADPDSAAAMGRRGRNLIESRYTWPRIAERSLKLYARYAEAARRPRAATGRVSSRG